jgi:hypothetical protein
MAQTIAGGVEHRGVVGMQHRLYREHLRMPAEWLHRAVDHGLSANAAVLLRPARAGAKSAAGGDKDGGSTLGFCHGTQIGGFTLVAAR